MVSLQQCVLVLGAVLALASSAYAVSCYQCESGFDERCGAEFTADSVFKVDCSRVPVPRFLQKLLPIKNATGCMKTVNEVSGVKHTTRSCYFGDIKGGNGCQADPSLPYFKQISCDVCSDNYCNGSSATGPIAATVILFAAIARMLY